MDYNVWAEVFLQQPHAALEHEGQFDQTEYGPMPSQLTLINVDQWIGEAEEEQPRLPLENL